jgi:hypothetical protein
MAYFESVSSRPVNAPASAQAPAPAKQPQLTPAAKKYLDRAVALSKGTGAISPEHSRELAHLAKKLTPADHLSMRQVSAAKMINKLTPIANNPSDRRSTAAKSLLKVVNAGILPGVGMTAGVWVKTGRPATREDVMKAKAAP